MSASYTITYQGKTYAVRVQRVGGELRISHDENDYSVEVEDTETAPLATPTPAGAGTPAIAAAAAPSPPAAPAAMPAAALANAPDPSAVASDADGLTIAAPMTGVVKEIHVAHGDTVSGNQLLITMEAMKMDIQVNASRGGAVAKLHVSAGASVQQGAPLITLC